MKSRLLFALVLVLAACGSEPPTEDRLSIVVTTTILGDVVENIVGENAMVEVLMPQGADAHDFQASAAQVASINRADLVVANGLGLEEGLLNVLAAATSDGVRVFEVAPLLNPIPFEDGHHHDDHDDHDEEDEELLLDPHVWMDPVRMADAARLIAVELGTIDPDGDWSSRAETYAQSLLDAHARIEALLDTVPEEDRIMVTNHASFGYFADRYGWEVVGTVIPGGTSLGAPSSADLADLIATIKHEGVRVIFVETSSPDDLARVVAAEVGEEVRVVTLYTESLGDAPADTLIGMLEENARRITQAMVDGQ